MTKQEILEEIKRKYPVGTKFYAAHRNKIGRKIEYVICEDTILKVVFESGIKVDYININNQKDNCGTLYYQGRWAPILFRPNKIFIGLKTKANESIS